MESSAASDVYKGQGQKRMNAGNIIRNALKNGILTIGDFAGMFEQTKIGM